MKKVWIVGAAGHVGQALVKLLDAKQYEIFVTDKDDVDITDEAQIKSFMHMNRPDVVINCAGIRKLNPNATLDVDTAYKVNAVGVRNLAQTAESIQAKLIQLSTDDLFAKASITPYNEFDQVKPEGAFGKSKYAGEQFVQQLMSRYVIIRSSWVYGIGKDFVSYVVESVQDDTVEEITIADNSVAIPTSAEELAKIVKIFIDGDHYGLYHAVCKGESCTRQEFAQEILHLMGKDHIKVKIREGAPEKYSVLDNMMLRITGLPTPGDWKEVLKDYMEKTGGNE